MQETNWSSLNEGQYEQEPLNEEDVPREPYGDNDEDLYDDENLANKDMENPVISGKFYGYVMEDYLGVPLNTMLEVFKDINDDELQVWNIKIWKETTSGLHRNKKYII